MEKTQPCLCPWTARPPPSCQQQQPRDAPRRSASRYSARVRQTLREYLASQKVKLIGKDVMTGQHCDVSGRGSQVHQDLLFCRRQWFHQGTHQRGRGHGLPGGAGMLQGRRNATCRRAQERARCDYGEGGKVSQVGRKNLAAEAD